MKPRIVSDTVSDKYTRTVTIEMSEADWEAYKSFAAAAAIGTAGRAASRLSLGSEPYWQLKLDWSKVG